jgi:phosphatidylserine/phosphatidylglycerophosphate/cardiolipin synthase-like enzyme
MTADQQTDPHDERILRPGRTCWRLERADRFTEIIDAADYFHHCKAAMLRAQHRIILIGWDFDTRTPFERGGKTLPGPNQLGPFLGSLLRKRPALEIFVLKSNLRLVPAFEGLWGSVTPVVVLNWFSDERMHFAIDGAHPTGSVHHQKLVVVDDGVAFCGGIDFTLERWDTPEHLHRSRFRRFLGRSYAPRHEVGAAVDGDAARALGELARDRWTSATGQSLSAVDGDRPVWPGKLTPTLRNVDVGIARTVPALDDRIEVREVEALNLEAISKARETIYLENQYLASRQLVDALVARLTEPDGPEVVIVMPRSSESRLEQQAMDSARHRLLQLLWAADDHRRFGVYWPVTDGGTAIYVHAKVLVIDDRLLRIGSSNLNNRSMGFDSECDLAVEAGPDAPGQEDARRVITSMRNRLASEHLAVSVDEFETAIRRHGSFLGAIESLRGQGRTLRQFTESTVDGEASPLAENDLMDPDHVPRSLTRSVQRWLEHLNE